MEKKSILITGVYGFVGRYMKQLIKSTDDFSIVSLPKNIDIRERSILCDFLSKKILTM